MDPYMAMLAGVEPDKMKGLADALRGSDARSTLAMLSGDQVLGAYGRNESQRNLQVGQQLAKSARARRQQEFQEGQNQLQRAMTQKYYDQLSAERERTAKLQRARAAETRRHNQAQEERWSLDRAARLEEARIRAAAKGSTVKAIPTKLQDTLATAGDEVKVMEELMGEINSGLNPGQEGIPLQSTVKTWLAGQYGIGDQDAIRKSEWWNKFNRQWNIVRRNEKFGATLSENEKKDWKAATINEEMQMGQLKTVMDIMRKYAHWNRNRRVRAAKASGLYEPTEIDILAGMDQIPSISFDEEGDVDTAHDAEPPPERSPRRDRTGKLYDATTGEWTDG